MKIQNLKELNKLLKLCRDNGVLGITVDGISLTLQLKPKAPTASTMDSDMFPEASIPVPRFTPLNDDKEETDAPEQIDTEDTLTEEQLMFYSSVPAVDTIETQ